MSRTSNDGRCSRCCLSYGGEGRLMCRRYQSTCQSVARNCIAPPGGYQLNEINVAHLLKVPKV